MDLTTIQAELKKLQAENAALKADKKKKVYIKLSEKGAMSIYGLGRFPFTFYKSQAEVVFSEEVVASVRQFLKDNEAKLKIKGDVTPIVAAA